MKTKRQKQILKEFSYMKTFLIDYQHQTGVNVSRTIDRLANDTLLKLLEKKKKGVIKK
jgi:hypothetical protein